MRTVWVARVRRQVDVRDDLSSGDWRTPKAVPDHAAMPETVSLCPRASDVDRRDAAGSFAGVVMERHAVCAESAELRRGRLTAGREAG